MDGDVRQVLGLHPYPPGALLRPAGRPGPSPPRTPRWRSSATCPCWRTRSWPGAWPARGVPMVFWHQDIYSEAIGSAARRRLPWSVHWSLGWRSAWNARSPAGVRRSWRSRRRSSNGSPPGASPTSRPWSPTGRPSTSCPCALRTNDWRRRATGLRGHPVVLYSGTFGLKHDPSDAGADRRAAAGVASRRPGGRDLGGQGTRLARGAGSATRARPPTTSCSWTSSRTRTCPPSWGPPTSSWPCSSPTRRGFSVPSKVLTYLCAGRAIVGVLPPDNSVAEILLTHGAGLVVDPARRDDVASEVARLLDDEACRRAMGRAGRRYAEQAFSPETAADRFVEVFGDAGARIGPAGRSGRMGPDGRWLPADKQCVTWGCPRRTPG